MLTLGTPAAGTVLTVNGSAFRFALNPKVGEFYNADTLVQAIMDEETITQRYNVWLLSPNQVKLEAWQTGSAYTPTVTCSDSSIGIAITEGVDSLRSQVKKEWGCYVEIWTCGGTFGSAVDKDTAVMAERMERLYSPENNYRFDISAILRRKLGRDLHTENDRLQAYFVRWGEIYTDQIRRRYPLGESEVLWVLDGALPITQQNSLSSLLLLNKPLSRVAQPLHNRYYSEALYALTAGGITLELKGYFQYYDGTGVSETFQTITPPGGVAKLGLGNIFNRAQQLNAVKKVLGCTVHLLATLGNAQTALAQLHYDFTPYTDKMQCVVFASSLSAYESFWFVGKEKSARRGADIYNRGLAAVANPWERSKGVRIVELAETTRLHSALLDKETFEWLRTELAASPDVFLYNRQDNTYRAVNITGMDEKANEEEQEYYLSLELEPGIPHNPLRY